jgi:tRNA A-37 threonylcarbamoyl transferase component Bud32
MFTHQLFITVCLVHGDLTTSNIMVRSSNSQVLPATAQAIKN